MTQTIPASQIVAVNPGVISAGGTGLDLNGLFLTTSYRVPIGEVLSFPNTAAVSAFFGSVSTEAACASIYFNGPDNSFVKPGAMLFAQYPWTLPVSAYLQSGPVSGLTLAQLQALSGVLTVTIDGTAYTSGSFSLAGATSFSSAAAIIQGNLSAYEGNITASIVAGAGAITGNISATTLNVTSVTSCAVVPGAVISGGGAVAGTVVVSQGNGTSGGVGNYTVNTSQTASNVTTTTSTNGMLNVSAVASGTLAIGQLVTGATVAAPTYITSDFSGTTGTGTYLVNQSQTVGSEAMQVGVSVVSYDSQSGSFFINAGRLGATSTIGYGSGTISGGLNFTQANGAQLSQGSAIATPLTYMAGIVNQTQNWFSLNIVFDPVTADKVLFAEWVNSQGVQYCYIDSTADASLLAPNPTTSSVYLIQQAGYNGTLPIYDPNLHVNGPLIGSFAAGFFASLAFQQTDGRTTLFGQHEAGLVPGVTSGTIASQLLLNGCNYYGAYGTANQNFVFLNNGSMLGQFLWADTYANAVWIKNALQLAMMTLLTTARSIPYNSAGDALIEAAAADPINQMVNFGAIVPGVQLSALQLAEVNAAAGLNIGPTLYSTGYYFQSKAATTPANIRAARGSPSINLWYVDGESVQQISLGSFVVQ